MATPRLTFLYPHLFRALRPHEPIIRHVKPSASRIEHLHVTSLRQLANRHGTAVEHKPPTSGGQEPRKTEVSEVKSSDSKQTTPNVEEIAASKDSKGSLPEENQHKEQASSKPSASAETPHQAPEIVIPQPTDDSPPPENILHIEDPTTLHSQKHKPPHLQAPPYVHHFDTFTLVRSLVSGTLTEEQSITAMKAIRSLLALNLDKAREGLVSKSDIEVQTYLFRAAISELKTEIQNMRNTEAEKMRTQRGQLQHEVDILGQKLTQELGMSRDDLKGMFNDRKMVVRMDQRAMESKIQELNYKITVMLNSDMKSEIEGLRWVLTRRAAMAIATMAFLILGSLRYSSYQAHLEHQREQAQQKQLKQEQSSSSREGSEVPVEAMG